MQNKRELFVILDIEKYDKEMLHLLNDPTTYRKLPLNSTMKYKSELERLILEVKGKSIINEREFTYLNIRHSCIPVICYLPKVHKNLENLPGRPIISGINSLTSRVSAYIDLFLQKYVQMMQSYSRAGQQLIEMLGTIQDPDNLLLCS